MVHLLGVQIDPPEPVCDEGQSQTEEKKLRTHWKILAVAQAAMPLNPLSGEPDMFMRISEEHTGMSAKKSSPRYGR